MHSRPILLAHSRKGDCGPTIGHIDRESLAVGVLGAEDDDGVVFDATFLDRVEMYAELTLRTGVIFLAEDLRRVRSAT